MPKTKISVTIEQSLVRECDRLSGRTSRSDVVERALSAWLREGRRRRLEQEIEQYYASLSDSERAEDSRWAEGAGATLGESWR